MKHLKAIPRRVGQIVALSSIAIFSKNSFALQPLSTFVQRGHSSNFDAREAAALVEQRNAEAAQAGRKLLPTLTAVGTYTHNQYEAAVTIPSTTGGAPRKGIITAYNQLDGNITLAVPIVDLAAWKRKSAGEASAEAAALRAESTQVDVERTITKSYFDLLAARAVVGAAERTLATDESNLAVIEQRRAAGIATALDKERAVAEVERAKQTLAQANYLAGAAARILATQSGLEPEKGGEVPSDDLHEEAPVATFLGGEKGHPLARAAAADARAQDASAKAATYTLLPTLGATAQERFTNATGFAGRSAVYQIQANITWRLDASNISASEAQASAAKVQAIREERVLRARTDEIKDAWDFVTAQTANARAARAEESANRSAARLAKERYDAGTALQLDVLQADRQAFQSEVNRIQADANLAYARTALRLAASASKDRSQ